MSGRAVTPKRGPRILPSGGAVDSTGGTEQTFFKIEKRNAPHSRRSGVPAQ
jgi:hypothetical protein